MLHSIILLGSAGEQAIFHQVSIFLKAEVRDKVLKRGCIALFSFLRFRMDSLIRIIDHLRHFPVVKG